MKTTAEKIAVMQAYEDGKTIAIISTSGGDSMEFSKADLFNGPLWDWVRNDYRIAEPKPDYIDWSQVPDSYLFMARNENGTATLFKAKPDLYPFGWSVLVEGETDFEMLTFVASAHAHASYKNNGIVWRESLVERPTDDVKTKDHVIWSAIPSQYRFMARDEGGKVKLFESLPIRNDSEWVSAGSSSNINHFWSSFARGSCDWKDSLIERPATQEAK